MTIPQALMSVIRPTTVIVGHYGAGKTTFTLNLALDLRRQDCAVTVVDLDIVNPYFRASEQRTLLEEAGVRLVAPVFAEAGTSLDVPSLTGLIDPAIRNATENGIVLVDAGGDDAGAVALGRFEKTVKRRGYAMLYVANRFRNLVADPPDALQNLREIEAASRLSVTALVNNSHLKDATTTADMQAGYGYARELAQLAGLPVACTTVAEGASAPAVDIPDAYALHAYVRTPWE